ncbi:tripartite motif-containing protein 66 isoform X2 [Sinocyclocheilus rhinocerous]|uniref:tripartite motif-containing protein 66 isoform X2 n=1 Tax=Sinocyclocheilus rhinocerous TaxID=307959 RepID=UPI0007B9BF44|nr:PREDICTED: tripartite motif-containing protein 66-like isoform X2 [Sinocyclocheilus rhinocerous]
MFTPHQTGRPASPRPVLQRTVCGCCAVCKVHLNSSADPRLLPCLHIVCNTCLTKICTDGATQDCPLCAQSFCLSEVTECAIFEDTSNNNKAPKCAGCEESEVSGWCVQCEEALCLDCISAHHRVKVTRDHEVTPKKPPTGWIQRRRCPSHTQESLRFFCLVCEELTCKDCQLITHRGHSFVQQEEAVGSQRQQLQSLLDSIRHQKETVISSLLLLEARLQEIEKIKVAAKKMLTQVVHSIYQTLVLKATQMLKVIEALFAEEVGCLLERKTSLNSLEGCQEYIAAFIDKILCTEGHCLLVHTKRIETQVKKLLSQKAYTPETMIELHLQIQNELCQHIMKFGFLRISKVLVPFTTQRTDSTQLESVSVKSSNPNSPLTATDVHPAPTSSSVDAQVQGECVLNSFTLRPCASSQIVQMNQALHSLPHPSQPSQPSHSNQARSAYNNVASSQPNQSKRSSSDLQSSSSSPSVQVQSHEVMSEQSKHAYSPSSNCVPYFPQSAPKTHMNYSLSVYSQPRLPLMNCTASQISNISESAKCRKAYCPTMQVSQTRILTRPLPVNSQKQPIPVNNQTPVPTHPIPANNQTLTPTHLVPANYQRPQLTHQIQVNNQTLAPTHPIPANNQAPLLTHQMAVSNQKQPISVNNQTPITHPLPANNQTPLLTRQMPINNQTPVPTHPILANNQTLIPTHAILANNQTPLLTHPIIANNQTPILTHPTSANNQTLTPTHPMPANNQTPLQTHQMAVNNQKQPISDNNQTPVTTHPISAYNQMPVLIQPIPVNNQTPVTTHPISAYNQMPVLIQPIPVNNQTPVTTHPISAYNQMPVLIQPIPVNNQTPVTTHPISAYNQMPVLIQPIPVNNQTPVTTHPISAYNQMPVLIQPIPVNNQTPKPTHPIPANNQMPVLIQPIPANNQSTILTHSLPTCNQTLILTHPIQTNFLGPGHSFSMQPNIPFTVLSTINALSLNDTTAISNVHFTEASSGRMNHCPQDPCAPNPTSTISNAIPSTASGSLLPVNPMPSAPISGNDTLWSKNGTYNSINVPVKALADSACDQDADVSSTNFTDTDHLESNLPTSHVSETAPKEPSPDPAHSSGPSNIHQDSLSTITEKCSRQTLDDQSSTKNYSGPKHWSVGMPITFRQLVEAKCIPVRSKDNLNTTPPADSTHCSTSEDLDGERTTHDKTVQSAFDYREAKKEDKESAVTLEHFRRQIKQFKRFLRVSLECLPISLPPSGQPLPEFHLITDTSTGHILVQESQGGQVNQVWRWHEDPLPSRSSSCSVSQDSDSSPASDVEFCAVCLSAGAPLLCAKCGCAFHYDCHIPPILTKPCKDWVCLLCQDLNETVMYGSEEMRTPSLSLEDQRKCEKLLFGLLCDENKSLLFSATKNHSKTAEFDIILGRLLGKRKPPYRTVAELVSDVWTLFDILMLNSERKNMVVKLKKSFQQQLNESFGKSLHASLLNHSSSKDPSRTPETEAEREKHRNTLKRMREFFTANCGTAAKKSCTDEGKERDGCGNTAAAE